MSSNPCNMAIFLFFSKMAAAAILDFYIFFIFNGRNGQECRTTSLCQILSKSLEQRSRYRIFGFFKMVAAGPVTRVGPTKAGPQQKLSGPRPAKITGLMIMFHLRVNFIHRYSYFSFHINNTCVSSFMIRFH